MTLCRVGNPEKGLGISRLPLELAWPLLSDMREATSDAGEAPPLALEKSAGSTPCETSGSC